MVESTPEQTGVQTGDKIRVIVVDDHPIYAEGLRRILDVEPDIEVVGWAQDGGEAVRLVDDLLPHVIVMDVRMPGLDGPTAARQIKANHPEIEILALSAYDDEEIVFSMIRAGSTGYILKDSAPEELAQAIRNMHAGRSQLDPAIARKVLHQFNSLTRAGSDDTSTLYDGLTDRELEVLRYVAGGKSNKVVATQLCISVRTVENHIRNIYQKLQIHDRTQAMFYAMRKGLVQL